MPNPYPTDRSRYTPVELIPFDKLRLTAAERIALINALREWRAAQTDPDHPNSPSIPYEQQTPTERLVVEASTTALVKLLSYQPEDNPSGSVNPPPGPDRRDKEKKRAYDRERKRKQREAAKKTNAKRAARSTSPSPTDPQ
jgi:hypothetical protein